MPLSDPPISNGKGSLELMGFDFKLITSSLISAR